MKKFLSLALALVMSMSLLTVGAGATEYKDLSDKNEIQYEEAVAVLNKLGIITGYEDGSFKPTGALTRGAAAKIIVSLMIGSEAASSLNVTAAPYKDVPVSNTFAAVISYCKTAGYISGYADGSFRPTAPLTGYAFTKMLLGALGYSSKVEGFTGSGWTMNAAKLGNKAGLFNDFASAFKGNDGVTREAACQLALNTLKATQVEYAGNSVNVSGDGINVSVGNNQYSYVYSNNNKINKNIKEGTATNDGYSLEFGEEHFSDLKLVSTNSTDDFGRPSNEWSYKNVKVGTYAKTADYAYTTTASGDTAADKVKDMGIKDYTVAAGVKAVVNGAEGAAISKVTDIPALMGKGTLVQLYTSETTANQITNVVVIKTQLMQVNSVTSSAVTLKKVESTGVSVAAVENDDDCYNALKGLKADDFVLVVPVEESAGKFVVNTVSVPQSVTGKLTKISTNKDPAVTGITVNGTDYKMSALWSSEDNNLVPGTTLSNSVDATAYLDNYGYAIYVKNVTASNSVIVIDEIYQSLVDGKLIKMAKGWDTTGATLTLNLGTANVTAAAGDVREYQTTTSNNAEYELLAAPSAMVKKSTAASYVAAGSTRLLLDGASAYSTQYFDSNVKFIFLSMDGSDVTGITVKEGVSEVGSASKKYDLQYTLNKAGTKITSVIVPNDNDAAVTANLMYISEVTGTTTVDNKTVSVFTAYIDGVKTENLTASKNNATVGFFTYSKSDAGVYTLSEYAQTSGKTTSVMKNETLVKETGIINDTYVVVGGKTLNAKNATVIDLTSSGKNFGSVKDLADDNATNYTVSLVYNDSTNTGAGTVSYLYVTARTAAGTTPVTPNSAISGLSLTDAGTSATVAFNTNNALVATNQIKVELFKNSAVDGVSLAASKTVAATDGTAQSVTGLNIPADGSYYVVVTVLTAANDSTVLATATSSNLYLTVA